jgi:hypothetical protein
VRHAGTTDVDVQVDLEVAGGAVHAGRLEQALISAGFSPDGATIWRWRYAGGPQAVIKFELLADLPTEPAEAVIRFSGCQDLGAVNLRGTGRAVRDARIQTLTATDDGVARSVELYVTGLAGYLVAKAAAARSRRKAKDWYDLAFVLLHNDHGGAREAAALVREVFGAETESLYSTLTDLRANFADAYTQGTRAYVDQFTLDHPEVDEATAAADAQLAVQAFCDQLLSAADEDR